MSDAVISDCGTYRYALWRELEGGLLGAGGKTVLFVMLNPSTADATQDDPTIRRCIGFAKRWGYTRLAVGNLFAYRATDPDELKLALDSIGPDNFDWLGRLAGEATEVVVAWGVPPIDGGGGLHVARVLNVLGTTLALGTTIDGFPRHPLYMPADAELQGWP